MGRLVQKFGGSSIASSEQLRRAAELTMQAHTEGHEVAVVVSAMGRTTDHLISLAEELTENPSPRELDMLLVTGEQQSISLMSMAIHCLGGSARSFTGGQAGIVTEALHGNAAIKQIHPQAIESCLMRGEIAVVAGFQGVTSNNEITTLGRGGSDTTAVALASALAAERCDIYTDVAGVYTADPFLLPEARCLPSVSYEEMLELSLSGAKVMHPRSVEVAMDNHMPVRVRSAFKPEDAGTLITHSLLTPEYPLLSVACDMSQASVTVAYPTKESTHALESVTGLFARLGELGVRVDMIMLLAREDEPTHELAFTVDRKAVSRVKKVIDLHFAKLGRADVEVDLNIARISAVGRGIANSPTLVASIFETLVNEDIPVSMVATGDLKISCVLPARFAREAVRLIHNRFGLSRNRPKSLE